MANWSAFPQCCGSYILAGLGGAPDHGIEYEYEGRGFDRKVKYDELGKPIYKKTYLDEYRRAMADMIKSGLYYKDQGLLCILNTKQMDAGWKEILEQDGWRWMSKWHNSVHPGSICHLFFLVKHQSSEPVPNHFEKEAV
jgi:hypothetical protein